MYEINKISRNWVRSAALCLCLAPGLAHADILSTVAGTGTAAASGDGGPASSASLISATGVAVDGAGNQYLAQLANIRKISAVSGSISSIAGTGKTGFSVDNGPADAAQVDQPFGVATDKAGNVYFADTYNHRIRMVTAFGTISTIAGTGGKGYSGDGAPASAARLNQPKGVAVDGSGNIYIADTGNFRVRKIAAGSGIITTIAGTGNYGRSGDGGLGSSADLADPSAVAVDSSGNVYVSADARVRMIAAVTGVISTVAGISGAPGYSGDGGQAAAAQLNYPAGLKVDSSGNLYIADSGNNRIRKVVLANGVISTVAGTGVAGFGDGATTAAKLNNPTDVAVDASGNLFIADTGNNRLRKLTFDGASIPLPTPGPSNPLVVPTLTSTSKIDCLYHWAEQNYPQIFAPQGASSQVLLGYYFRYYAGSNTYVAYATSIDRIYLVGPLSNNSVLDLGPAAGLLTASACQ